MANANGYYSYATTTAGTSSTISFTDSTYTPFIISTGPSNVQSYTYQPAPSIVQWNGQVFLDPSPKLKALFTALQLL